MIVWRLLRQNYVMHVILSQSLGGHPDEVGVLPEGRDGGRARVAHA